VQPFSVRRLFYQWGRPGRAMDERAFTSFARSPGCNDSVSVAIARRMLPFCSTTNELPQLKQTANGPIRATGSPVLLQTGQVISVIVVAWIVNPRADE